MDAQHPLDRKPSCRPLLRRAYIPAALLLLALTFLSYADASPEQGAQQDGEVAQAFQMSARHWGVPLQVLMAVGYVESRWEQRSGVASLDNGYGIMHITDRPDGTMSRASALTGLPPDAIRDYPEANIEAGAALLSDISRKISDTKLSQTDLAGWYAVVEAYSAATDPNVADMYAHEVFGVIQAGQSATLQSGEHIVMPPTVVTGLPAAKASAPQSQDYPSALWVPANPNNYQMGRPYPPIDTIIIHDTEGSYASAISWFQNPSAVASAHYVVRSSDGQITQMVRNADTAYQAGNWDYNVRAIGVEHEGYESQQGWYTEAMYQSSSALVRYLTDHYGIKKDRAHIIGHYQVPNQSHTDPGPYWDWNHYMSLVRRDSERAALVDNTDPGFAAVPAQIDPQHYWWTYTGGYANSNTFDTTSVTYQPSSVNSATWTTQLPTSGYYDVYAFIPYVDNHTPDTSSAKYSITNGGTTTVAVVSQSAITDVGSGSWANIGKFYFTAGQSVQVGLSDWTGETGKNVWFDAVMWIPSISNEPPPTPATTPTSVPTATAGPTRTATATRAAVISPTAIASPTAAATWTPGPCGMRFSDLPDTSWAYNYVAYLYCAGAISGYDDGMFRPNNGSTRGQFAKMLVLAMGWTQYDPVGPDFSDVPPGSTFYPYIEAAFAHGTINGYADGTFRPNGHVTRAQAAKMLVLGRGWSLFTPRNPSFSDVPQTHWAYSYVETAALHSVVSGYADGTFAPERLVTRAQLSKMVALTAQAAQPENVGPPSQPTSTLPGKVYLPDK